MPAPPTTWVAAWESYVGDHDIPWIDLDAADEALMSFWRPLLVTEEGSGPAHWDADGWTWAGVMRLASLQLSGSGAASPVLEWTLRLTGDPPSAST